MRSHSTAFVVFLTVFAVVMFAVFYSHDVLRDETQREVSAMQSAGVLDPGCPCRFVPSSGSRFGSPDGTPARGFNELNSWVAAWGPIDPICGCDVRIALMPGITPPDSTGTGARYTVELNNVQIGTLTVSDTVSVSIAEPMPRFMQIVRIWLEPGGYVLYDNGPRPAVALAPGTYQVRATLRVVPRSDVYGSTADLTLTCNGTPTATITLRVPNPDEWGLRADIYTYTGAFDAPWPPFQGPHYTYRGTWSVGAIYHLEPYPFINPPNLVSPYFTNVVGRTGIRPKWADYWINDPAARWAIKFTGRLYVPWSSIRVGFWHDDGVYVKLCDIDRAWWYWSSYLESVSGTCTGAPGEYSVEIGFYQRGGPGGLIFVIGPGDRGEAYIPTIDGAWYCANFNWNQGTCGVSWSFVPASPSVPHFRGTSYTPSSTNDGGGTPRP